MERPGMSVKDWMRSPVHIVKPRDGIDHARNLCEHNRVNQLPVLAAGQLLGIVTDRDLRDAFPSVLEEAEHPTRVRRELAGIHVEDVMTPNVLTVLGSDPIERAATIMRRERIGALPVMHDGKLVGILTRSDLLAALVALAGACRATAH
ncbi:MAG: CBS domain-containing protein [Candidatus Binatia bacterium]